MAYKEILFMDIYEIIRRWHAKQSISHIANSLGYDRKTVCSYVKDAIDNGITQQEQLPPKNKIFKLLFCSVKQIRRKQNEKRYATPSGAQNVGMYRCSDSTGKQCL